MSIKLLTNEEFLEYAKYYLLRNNVTDGNGVILDKDRFDSIKETFDENVVKYTLDAKELCLLESYLFRKRRDLAEMFDLDESMFLSVNDIVSADYSRVSQSISKDEFKAEYYYLVGGVWEKLRMIVDEMRKTNFNVASV